MRLPEASALYLQGENWEKVPTSSILSFEIAQMWGKKKKKSMKFPKEFCRCGWHKAAFSLKASCVEVFFSILPEIRKAEILFFIRFMSAP